jgi:hypothetical protein
VSLRNWADLSVFLLSLECMVLLVIALVIGYFLVRLMNAAHYKTLGGLNKVQGISRIVAEKTDVLGGKVAQPVIRTRGLFSRVLAIPRAVVHGNPKDDPNSQSSKEKKS